jgi:outer membrane biosynthesis protein TonB
VSAKADSLKGLQAWVDESRKNKPFPWRTYGPYMLGAAAVLLVIFVIARGDKTSDERADTPAVIVPPPKPQVQPPPPPPAPKPEPPRPLPPPPPPEPQAEIAPPPEVTPAEDEIEMDPVTAQHPRPAPAPAPRKPAEPKPTESAETLYSRGIDFYRRGDAKAALEQLTEARRANPTYVPVWYGLGLVHESLGNKGAAKSAYERYLKLAPNAANADQVRYRSSRL